MEKNEKKKDNRVYEKEQKIESKGKRRKKENRD